MITKGTIDKLRTANPPFIPVKAFRLALGLSRKDFSGLSGIKYETLHKAETGKQDLSRRDTWACLALYSLAQAMQRKTGDIESLIASMRADIAAKRELSPLADLDMLPDHLGPQEQETPVIPRAILNKLRPAKGLKPRDKGKPYIGGSNWLSYLQSKLIHIENPSAEGGYDIAVLAEPSLHNLRAAIQHHPRLAGLFAFDTFFHRVFITHAPPWVRDSGQGGTFKPRALEDLDLVYLESFLGALDIGLNAIPPRNLRPALELAARENTFNSITQILDGLVWDGSPRLASFLPHTLECVQGNTYDIGNMGRGFFVHAVKRLYNPGHNAAHMLAFKTDRGDALRDLGQVLCDFPITPNPYRGGLTVGRKSLPQNMAGVILAEIGHLAAHTMGRHTTLLSFVQAVEDSYAPSSLGGVRTMPRQFSLWGSIPQGLEVHPALTENRALMVVPCLSTFSDGVLNTVSHMRDQLWAEAVHYHKQNLRPFAPWSNVLRMINTP